MAARRRRESRAEKLTHVTTTRLQLHPATLAEAGDESIGRSRPRRDACGRRHGCLSEDETRAIYAASFNFAPITPRTQRHSPKPGRHLDWCRRKPDDGFDASHDLEIFPRARACRGIGFHAATA